MSPIHARSLFTLAATAATVAAAPAPAWADGFGCTASTVRATVLGQTVEPVRAGAPGACADGEQALDALGAPLAADRAVARTAMRDGRALSATSLSGFRAGSLGGLAGELPRVELPAELSALPVPVPAAGQLLGLPSLLTVDAVDAARALVTDRVLPDVPLVGADLVQLAGVAGCQSANPVLDAAARVERLTALGQSFAGDQPVDTAATIAPAQLVDFSKIDVEAIDLPAGLSLSDPLTGAILRSALEAAVAGLPSVSVPAEVARVRVDPPRREGDAGAVRQIGPRVRVEALGRELADVTLGETLASAVCDLPAVVAAEPPLSPATELALSCAPSDVVLTDVVEKNGRVKLVGLAAARFVGRTVDLVLTSSGKRVATAVVQPDGWFRARAPLPAKRIRFTNLARYQAVIDDERSLRLKLHRRMRITRMKPAGETLTITGRIYGRRADDEVVVTRRESCTKDVEVTTVKPRRDGSWRVTVPVPEGVDAATYRATTRVRRAAGAKRFRTFSLPGHVAL